MHTQNHFFAVFYYRFLYNKNYKKLMHTQNHFFVVFYYRFFYNKKLQKN
jgi:hypothetical protein